jgi:hypothetical protein
MERRQMSPPLKCSFSIVYNAIKAMPNHRVHGLVTTGGVQFDVEANVTRDGREFIDLPHNNRIYQGDWGFQTNNMGKDGQRIGQYARPLDEWYLS